MYSALQAVWLFSTACLCGSGALVLCVWKAAVEQESGTPLCLQHYALPGTRYSRAGRSDSSVMLSSFGGSKVTLDMVDEPASRGAVEELKDPAMEGVEMSRFIEV
ncbi:uncharacterized protein LOC129597279 [Paramacrobiotus metropolitanus]|uniref:uncharacterized protein LOC129597279 n=1 Tax=Paramacrobiotus metropolitanus TaxID=2943436 RepID=UPI002445B4C8|nr:uncharacterized protein LOC129597279 [Paramacrobiotus metropolitanus]